MHYAPSSRYPIEGSTFMRLRVLNRTKRSRQVFMTDEDNAAFSEILRAEISPIEILTADFDKKELRRLNSLVDQKAPEIFITSPTVGDLSFKHLARILRRSSDLTGEPFRSALPKRQVAYIPIRGIHRATSRHSPEGGVEVEVFNEAVFQFVYDRGDAVAEAFSNKIIRLLDKYVVRRFAIVNSKTGEPIREVLPEEGWRAGPNVIDSCRRHARRYVCFVGSDENGVGECLAPLRLNQTSSTTSGNTDPVRPQRSPKPGA